MSEHREGLTGEMPDGHYRFAYEKLLERVYKLESKLTESQAQLETQKTLSEYQGVLLKNLEAQLEEIRGYLKSEIIDTHEFRRSGNNLQFCINELADKLLTPKGV